MFMFSLVGLLERSCCGRFEGQPSEMLYKISCKDSTVSAQIEKSIPACETST